MYVLEHEQTGLPIFTWQTEFGPQGEGLQGDIGFTSPSAMAKVVCQIRNVQFSFISLRHPIPRRKKQDKKGSYLKAYLYHSL